VTGDPANYIDRLKAYVGQLGISFEYSSDIAPAKGLSEGGKTTLLPDLSPAESMAVPWLPTCMKTFIAETKPSNCHNEVADQS
jgi:hypothetical protein